MTFEGAAQATTLDGAATKMETQTIARGPVAALVAIKQLGTNGGGFFGPNSTHPFENPTPWSNLLSSRLRSSLLPMASLVMFGLMLRNMRHAAVIYGVMLALLVVAASVVADPAAEVAAERRRRDGPAGRRGGRTWRARRSGFGPVAVGDLGGDDHGHVERLGQLHARQPQPARRAGAACRMMMLNCVFGGIGAGFDQHADVPDRRPCSSPG